MSDEKLTLTPLCIEGYDLDGTVRLGAPPPRSSLSDEEIAEAERQGRKKFEELWEKYGKGLEGKLELKLRETGEASLVPVDSLTQHLVGC